MFDFTSYCLGLMTPFFMLLAFLLVITCVLAPIGRWLRRREERRQAREGKLHHEVDGTPYYSRRNP
jgi:predicted PurR-regulated permease PerM